MTAPEADGCPPRRRRGLVTAALTLFCLAAYTVVVTYDLRAWVVFPSLWRYVRFPVDPSIDRLLPRPPPEDPSALGAFVRELLPWTPDFRVYGVPWYFPTPREALAAGRGDCEAQAVVFASLLAARGIPYTFRASFSHLWVDYPGRIDRPGESRAEALMQNVGGRYRFHWPKLPRLAEHLRAQRALLWDPLAPVRKLLLLLGWPVILIGVPWGRRETRRGDERATA